MRSRLPSAASPGLRPRGGRTPKSRPPGRPPSGPSRISSPVSTESSPSGPVEVWSRWVYRAHTDDLVADPIEFVEAAYANAERRRMARLPSRRLVVQCWTTGKGLLAFIHDTRDPYWVTIGAVSTVGFDPALAGALLNAPVDRGADTWSMTQILRGTLVTTARRELPRAAPNLRDQFDYGLQAAGVADARVVNATDPSHAGVTFVAPTVAHARWSAREKHRWSQLAAHASAGLRIQRLRRHLAPTNGSGISEAILRLDGHVEHAEASARGDRARAALRRGVLALERARGPLRRQDADDALATWEALVAGRWSLVDRFESDGRRYLVAHRNDPDAPDLRGLTLRERQVVGYAAMLAIPTRSSRTNSDCFRRRSPGTWLGRAPSSPRAKPSLEAIREVLAVLPPPSAAARR